MNTAILLKVRLVDYLSFCLERNINPTYENSVLFLKALTYNKIVGKLPYKYYDKFKMKMKKKLDANNNTAFQITLKFANPN